MYNEDIKRKFIDDYTNNDVAAKNVIAQLNIMSKIETTYKKDLYYLSYEEISDMIFDIANILSYRTYYQYISLVKFYKQWCIIHHVFNTDSFVPISVTPDIELEEIYRKFIKRNIFKNFNDLHEFIDDIFVTEDIPDFMLRNEYFKLFVLLVYHGIVEDDVFNITVDDVIIKNNGVFLNLENELIQLEDDETIRIIKKRCSCHQYGSYRGNGAYHVKLISNRLISFDENDESGASKYIKSELKRTLKSYNKETKENKKIHIFNIYVCGKIRKIKETENNTLTLNKLYKHFDEKYISPRGKRKTIKEIYEMW